MLVGLGKDKILPAIEIVLAQKTNDIGTVVDYNALNVSEKLLRIVISYLI